jgi:hypothetical protein
MKLIFFLSLLLAISADAVLPVIDAVGLANQRLNADRDYLEQLFHAAQGEEELRRLAQQIVQVDETLRRLGDPALVSKLAGSEILEELLKQGELNKASKELIKGVSGMDILLKNPAIGTEVRVDGQVVAKRDEKLYAPAASLQRALEQFESVKNGVLQQRAQLKREIVANVEATRAAGTSSEVEKLQAVAASLNTELAALDRELQFASMDIGYLAESNRTQREVETKAQFEVEKAVLRVSSQQDAKTFRLPTAPVLFNR